MKKIIKHYPMTDRLIVRRGYYKYKSNIGIVLLYPENSNPSSYSLYAEPMSIRKSHIRVFM